MASKENPAALPGADRAGIRYAEQLSFTREHQANQPLGHLRRQRQVERICRTPRLVAELLDEIARHHPEIADDLDRRLAAYAGLDPALLIATGGDRFAPSPLRAVGERR